MRTAIIGLLACAGLIVVATGSPPLRREARGERPLSPIAPRSAVSDQLITIAFDHGQDHDQVTLIDPTSRVLGVYHIDRATGAVTLKSVRNIHWDLQMDEFNSISPSPSEIRSLLQPR